MTSPTEREGAAFNALAPTPALHERTIAVLAPTGNDALLTQRVLTSSGMAVQVCASIGELCRAVEESCAAILLAEETLKTDAVLVLVDSLARQPAWSDLPVIIITSGGEADQARLRRLAVFGPGSNVSLLERPFRPGTLTSTVAAALRSRLRQYQVRDLLQSVRASEARYQHILASISDAFIAVGRDWRVTYVNESYRQLIAPLGISTSLLGRDFWASVPVPTETESRLRRAMADQKPDSMEVFFEPLQMWLDLRIYPSPETLTIYLRDVTRRKRHQDEVREARDAAEKANRAKDDFLAALSHELRTPLNPVLLLATEAAANPALSSALRADFEMIAKNVLLEAHLIDDLLDLTRITRGKLVLDSRPVTAHQILQDAIANVRAEVLEKELVLQTNLGPENPLIHGDPVRLQQVFWNVLKNAAKFTPRGGQIIVTTGIDLAAATLFVKIADNGAGMSPAELSRIFDAFAQGDHAAVGSPHRFGGLGLGLAISRSLVELHSGRIRADSPGVGQGSTFTIELPIASAPKGDRPDVNPLPTAGNSRVQFPGIRVLLVEDHLPTRSVLTHLLEARNYAVVAAATVAEARGFGLTQAFDLLITDIGLPDGNGYDLMRELGNARQLPGVALTGYGAEQDVQRARQAGFVAHLTKPISIRSLDGVLEKMTAIARPPRAPTQPPNPS